MNPPLDPWRDVMGVDLPEARRDENLEAFRDILAEIQKLRALDLTDVHPAIVYDRLIPYRQAPDRSRPDAGEVPL